MIDYEALNIAQTVSETDTFTEARYRQFYKYFPKNTHTVLDVGCNTGRGGRILKSIDSTLAISGLDIVQERVNALSDDIYDKKICGLLTQVPQDDSTFDAVVAGEVIEHLHSSDVMPALEEIFRVLNIGGRFLLTTPNPLDIKRKFRKRTILGGSHLSQHFHKVLRIQLMMAGFSNVKVYGSGKVSNYLGYRFPVLSIYGSYLLTADKF